MNTHISYISNTFNVVKISALLGHLQFLIQILLWPKDKEKYCFISFSRVIMINKIKIKEDVNQQFKGVIKSQAHQLLGSHHHLK